MHILCFVQMHGMAIRRNTIQCMQAIIEAAGNLQIELTGEAAAAAARVAKLDEAAELTPEVVQVTFVLGKLGRGGWGKVGIVAEYFARTKYVRR